MTQILSVYKNAILDLIDDVMTQKIIFSVAFVKLILRQISILQNMPLKH